jgi:hypothetical protein
MKILRFSIFTIMLALLLASCNMPGSAPVAAEAPPPIEKAQVSFSVSTKRPLEPGESIELVVVDEVTGLPFNPERIPLTLTEDGKHLVTYPAPVGTLLTYRYEKIAKNGSRVPEVTPAGKQIRYRMYDIRQPAMVDETIAGWENDLPDPADTGSLTGQVVSQDLGLPLGDLIVTAGGVQTITDANGYFTLHPVTSGSHTLVAISINGSFKPFQAKTLIAPDKVTPVEVAMSPTTWKQVTFEVEVPADTVEGAPIRLAGNLTQLGNTFIELGGGMSGDTKQMPALTRTEAGTHTVTLTLPAGIDIRYKYTLGDGFWNSEHGMDQRFLTHQLIIPEDEDNLVIHDQVHSWQTSKTATIWFRAIVPENTPKDEQIGIQFFLGSWMPALPMFKIKENTWAFPLLSPHNFTGDIPYRYCRNTPCTGAIQAGVEKLTSPRTTTTRFDEVHLVNDTVSSWAFLSISVNDLPSLPSAPTAPEDFIAGLSFTPYYTPASKSYINSLLTANQKPYNHIVLSPAWQAVSTQPPILFEPTLEGTPRVDEIIAEIETAHNRGLSVGLFPLINFPINYLNWWEAVPTNKEITWKIFLDQYRQMVYQYAEIAEMTGTETFILGGEWLLPALPIENNAAVYDLPGNIESIWQETISGVQERFSGDIGWHLSIEVADEPPAFLSMVDKFYLQWDLPADSYEDLNQLADQIGSKLDSIAEPLKTNLGKPLILMLAYPSLQEYQEGCISSSKDEGSCIDISSLLMSPSVENPAMADLQAQAEYYYAFISAADQRGWIDGVVSQGYYSTNQIHDTSASIHGKPAEAIFESWISLLLGK